MQTVAAEPSLVERDVLDDAIVELEANACEQTDGVWLEDLVQSVAPHLREWNVDGCWRWQHWPERDEVMPEGTPAVDVGIDLVARRRDGAWIAIQVKSRELDEHGEGLRVTSDELNKFLAAASNAAVWAERWMVVNGAVSLGGHSPAKVSMSGEPVKVVNVAQAVASQRAALVTSVEEQCPHCDPVAGGHTDDEEPPIQTRSCMQREAVETAVARLRANEQADEHNIARGEARGRIVLPCGTGKTRVALRIIERLTYPGELSVVLCPSIALVAQIRREFLQHTDTSLRVMAVCSDQGVGADEEKVVNTDDTTVDRGLSGTEDIKGCLVTTDSGEIAEWIRNRRAGRAADSVSVIFGTYQSARRVSEAIAEAAAADGFKVLVCDEAHRTAGVRRKKRGTAVEARLGEFTLCHDREAFPATYRVYQTATPRIFGDNALAQAAGRADRGDFVIRQMDDQQTFGIELFRKSYAEAVRNGWLSDYRIIAMAVGGQEATDLANALVREADEAAAYEAAAAAERNKRATPPSRRGGQLPTTGDYLKGMAFALTIGGGAKAVSGERVPLRSCIGFVNTIARSKAMTAVLQSEAVRDWVAGQAGERVPQYRLEHLDASSPVAARDEAKRKLAGASTEVPHSILNVGIFGEGTDSPSLSAVAFLEPRRSPIDVVQAVGRAMRRAEGKELGYIIVPVVIPPGVDAERHLSVSDKHEGWRELGDILQALRAHDQRIEDALPEVLTIQLPPAPQREELELRTVVAVGRPDQKNLEYAVVAGSWDRAEDTARAAVKEQRSLLAYDNTERFDMSLWEDLKDEPTSMIVHVERPDGSTETRQDSVVRHKPKPNQPPQEAPVNERQTKRRAGQVANGERGRTLPDPSERAKHRAQREAQKQAAFEQYIQGTLLDLSEQMGTNIAMNLLEKSGLTGNRVQRDLNLLRDAVNEAARYIHAESGLAAELDAHFGLDELSAPKAGKPRADGATIAALLWMNAAMLHQRIHAGGWLKLKNIEPLADIKASTEPEDVFRDSWNAITRQDFLPVLEPALEALRTAARTKRLGGLRRALRHLAAEAEQIAETYADMGTDHAGALFNQVMGDQASDGAFFTRPVAATLAARLTLDAVDPDNALDWTDPDVWRQHRTVDLACGSGTLLTAVMAEMRRRAAEQGAGTDQLAKLQQVAVEETIKGLDINPVSLQLAATQLMSGNADVKYRRMGLHLMPYGRQADGTVAAGTPELFGRQDIVSSLRLFDDAAVSSRVKTGAESGTVLESRGQGHRPSATGVKAGSESAPVLEGPEMDDAVADVKDARIVIMNPPFTNRSKMGEKFGKDTQKALRSRMDTLEGFLAAADRPLSEILDKNTLEPRFVGLADLCLNRESGVFTTVIPTTALTAVSALPKRLELAKRFHVHTILTCHNPSNINLSQNTNINESIVVMQRFNHDVHPPPPPPETRIVSLDRLPADDNEAEQLFKNLAECEAGMLADGWGEVSHWPAERIIAGDWTASIWRASELATAAAQFAVHPDLTNIGGGGERQEFTRRGRRSAADTAGPLHGTDSVDGACDTADALRGTPQGTRARAGEQFAGRVRDVKRAGYLRASRGAAVNATGQSMRDDYHKQPSGEHQPFPILASKGADGQQQIEAHPDEHWEWKKPGSPPILEKAGFLLVAMGQRVSTARLNAVASDQRYVGQAWMPVTELNAQQAKAVSVFLNSTPGRLLILRHPGRTLPFPLYNPAAWHLVGIPDITDERIVDTLAECWVQTRHEIVPQFRDGYTDIRRRWDAAVSEAMRWDIDRIAELGELLAHEPYVTGVAHGQWKP